MQKPNLDAAIGQAAQVLLHDPRISPGAFALVGMGTFYGPVVGALIVVSMQNYLAQFGE